MRRLAVIALVAPLLLSGCFGVTEKHSVLVKPVPVKLLFQSTPSPGVKPPSAPVTPPVAPQTPGAVRSPVPAPVTQPPPTRAAPTPVTRR